MSIQELSVRREHHLRTPDDVIRHAASGIPDIFGIAQLQAKNPVRQYTAILHPLMLLGLIDMKGRHMHDLQACIRLGWQGG